MDTTKEDVPKIEGIIKRFDDKFAYQNMVQDEIELSAMHDWIRTELTTLQTELIRQADSLKETEECDRGCDGYCEESGCSSMRRRYRNIGIDDTKTIINSVFE